MEFIDHTGHVFSLPSYARYPIGYQYEQQPYIFWLDTDNTFYLSVNNYYIRTIKAIIPVDDYSDITNITVTTDSTVFKLVNPIKPNEIESLTDIIQLSENDDLVSSVDYIDAENNVDNTVYIENPESYVYYEYQYLFTYDNTVITSDTDESVIHIYTGKPYVDDNGNIKGIVNDTYTKYEDVEINLYENKFDYFENFPIKTTKHSINDLSKYTVESENDNIYIYDKYGIKRLLSFNVQKYIMLPIYVIGLSEEEGTITSNALISVTYENSNEEYCVFGIGGIFKDEEEALIINGKNMGINLPKDILRAFYNYGFYNNNVDEALYNEKIKELLMNYMNIKGNCGNYQSVINSLKWFGWGNHITISKLLYTDNQFINQYLKDYFDINNDVTYNYKHFKNVAFISLQVPENQETGNIYVQNIKNDFWGEGTPELEDLFNKTIEITYDEEDIIFNKQYYNYTMQEMALKLAALKYYYNKYFLPIHLKIHSATIMHRAYMNDIKMISNCNIKITEVPQLLHDEHITVTFDKWLDENNLVEQNKYYHFIYKQSHYIDNNFNEFVNSKEIGETTNEEIYYIDDYCINVPISFDYTYDNEDYGHFFNCNLFLHRDNTLLYSSNFQFTQHHNYTNGNYSNFVIIPSLIAESFNLIEWVNKEITISLCVNGNWYYHTFYIKNPELYIQFGTLTYDYYASDGTMKFNQLEKIDIENKKIYFNSYIHNPKLVMVTNSNFVNEIKYYMEYNNAEYVVDLNDITSLYYYVIYNNVRYVIGYSENEILKYTNNKWELENITNINGLQDYLNDSPVFYSSLTNTLTDYINTNYKEKINIVTNTKYLNRCYMYNILNNDGELLKYDVESKYLIDDNGEYVLTADNKNILIYNGESTFTFNDLTWGDNSSDNVYTLYATFFNENGTLNNTLAKAVNNINKDMSNYYDFYLMHDNDYWYGIFISKYTIDTNYYNNEFDKSDIVFNNYTLQYARKDNKFLINRMKYTESTINAFNTDDIIVATITNKDKLPFKLSIGSQWKFEPLSIGMSTNANVTSNTEMAIISIGNKNSKYERGYYNVYTRYTIDNYTQNQQIKTAKIRIG